MKLIIKEIDVFRSLKFKNKTIKHCIIYVMLDTVAVEAVLTENDVDTEKMAKYLIDKHNINHIERISIN